MEVADLGWLIRVQKTDAAARVVDGASDLAVLMQMLVSRGGLMDLLRNHDYSIGDFQVLSSAIASTVVRRGCYCAILKCKTPKSPPDFPPKCKTA